MKSKLNLSKVYVQLSNGQVIKRKPKKITRSGNIVTITIIFNGEERYIEYGSKYININNLPQYPNRFTLGGLVGRKGEKE